jgi:DNA repair exonuclease SbcCD ATPase subunit
MGAHMMADILGEDDQISGVAAGMAAATGESAEGTAEAEMLQQFGGEMERSFKQADENVNELRKEINTPRAKRLLDGLMGELVGERSKVQEIAKKLNLTIRQKEIEFRNKNQVVTEELRRANEQLKQKTFALSRSKEQLTQALMAAERLKMNGGAGVGEDGAAYKQKFTQQSKLLANVKNENLTLMSKIEELKDLLNTEKMSSKSRGPSIQDFSSLQGRYERAQRQADEFKRTNQQLLERLNEQQRKGLGSAGASVDEMRKRLEAATKIVANNKKDQERLNQKIEDMRREELRLKGDLNKAVTELKRARAAGFGSPQGGGKDGGGQAA